MYKIIINLIGAFCITFSCVILVEAKTRYEVKTKKCSFYTFIRPMLVRKEHYKVVTRDKGKFIQLLLCGMTIKVDDKFPGGEDLLISKVNGKFLIETF